jgi:hypothetical protein
MMKYIAVTNEAEAQYISALIYDLTRPAGGATDTTQYSVPWQHDVNGTCYLRVSLGFELPVHADRGNAIETALRGLQTAGKLSQSSVDNILALASTNVGNVVTVGQVLPAEWLAVALDSIVLPPEEVVPE